MAPTATLITPTNLSLRSGQAALAQIASSDLDKVWAQLHGVDEAKTAMNDLLPGLVDKYGHASSALAADWYDEARGLTGMKGTFSAIPADLPEQGIQSLVNWAGNADDVPAMRLLVQGGMQRRISNWSRATIVGSSVADPRAHGWQRVGAPGECEFCEMLIGRGAVYTEKTAVFRSHDHCHCSAQPSWKAGAKPIPAAQAASKEVMGDADKATVRSRVSELRENKASAVYQQDVVDDLFGRMVSGEITPAQIEALANADSASSLAKSNAERAVRKYQEHLKAQTIAKQAAAQKANFKALLEAQKAEAAKTAAKKAPVSLKKPGGGPVSLKRKTEFDPLQWGSTKDARDWAYSVWGGPQRLTQSEFQALWDYTGNGYGPINRGLRASKGARVSKKAHSLDEAIDHSPRVPHDIVVTRNSSLKQLGITGKRDPRSSVGGVLQDHGYMSTSVNNRGAMSGEVRLSIRVPKGSKGIYVSGDGAGKGVISSFGSGESELILARDSSLKIISVAKRGNRWHVVADLIQ